MKHTFQNDDQITREYFGLNSVFMSCSSSSESSNSDRDFEDFMEMFETALQMGNQLMALLLEKMYESSKGHVKQSSFGQQGTVSQSAVIAGATSFHHKLSSLEKDVDLCRHQNSSLAEDRHLSNLANI